MRLSFAIKQRKSRCITRAKAVDPLRPEPYDAAALETKRTLTQPSESSARKRMRDAAPNPAQPECWICGGHHLRKDCPQRVGPTGKGGKGGDKKGKGKGKDQGDKNHNAQPSRKKKKPSSKMSK